MNAPVNPFQHVVAWLAAHASFPATRLEPRAELLVCFAALAAAEERTRHGAAGAGPAREGAQIAAQRAHALRRSHTHLRSDNSAKV